MDTFLNTIDKSRKEFSRQLTEHGWTFKEIDNVYDDLNEYIIVNRYFAHVITEIKFNDETLVNVKITNIPNCREIIKLADSL